MFDRCDSDTAVVLDVGLAEARGRGHNRLGTEDLLLALVQHHDRLPPIVVRILPTVAQVQAAMDAEVLGPRPADADLLATLGIDLDAVQTSVRHAFGSDALDRLARRRAHRPRAPWRRRRRRCISLLGDHVSVAPRVKQALEHAVEDAARRGRRVIDPAGLLLGMVEVEDAMSNQLLRAVGVEPNEVRAALHEARRRTERPDIG
jgi:hypothetical protein